MKKIIVLLLGALAIFGLTSCKEEEKVIKIVTPGGAPLMTQVGIYDRSQNEEFTIAGYKVSLTTVGGPDQIKAAFGSKDYDLIISPVNIGAAMYRSKQEYLYAANITSGNIFLASTSKLESYADLKDKKIVIFGKGTINETALKLVLENKGINQELDYLASAKDTNAKLIADKDPDTVYLVAEPALTAAKAKLKQAGKMVYILDIVSEYEKLKGIDFVQAGIFAKKEIALDFLNEYLALVEADINSYNSNSENLTRILDKYLKEDGTSLLGFPPSKIVSKALKGCNLNFIKGKAAKKSLEVIVGGDQLGEEFYL